MLEESQGLAFIKNKWVAVDPEKLKQALEACNRIEDLVASGMTLGTAMRTRLDPEKNAWPRQGRPGGYQCIQRNMADVRTGKDDPPGTG